MVQNTDKARTPLTTLIEGFKNRRMKEIALMSYWEHFKRAKELALIYPPEHPLRQKIESVLSELQSKLKSDSGNNK